MQRNCKSCSLQAEVDVRNDSTIADEDHPLVLIANDQEWTGRAVESILAANGYRVVQAYTAREALAVANAVGPDLVILDQQLPDFSGVEVCRQLRSDPRFGATLPIIITTAGPSGRPQRLTAYAAGAWEFYGQPLDSDALLHKLRVYLASYREVRRLRAAALVESHGLYTQAGLAQRATEVAAEMRRSGRPLACVAWSFGAVEDSSLLDRLMAAFRQNGRASDVLGRLDTGELAVVAGGTSASGASQIAERFRRILTAALGVNDGAVRSTVVGIDDPVEIPSTGSELLERLTLALAA
jgi:PleD family two-component response regulator